MPDPNPDRLHAERHDTDKPEHVVEGLSVHDWPWPVLQAGVALVFVGLVLWVLLSAVAALLP